MTLCHKKVDSIPVHSRFPKRLPLYCAIVCLSPTPPFYLVLVLPWAAHLAGSSPSAAGILPAGDGGAKDPGTRTRHRHWLCRPVCGMSVSTYTNFQLFACKITRHRQKQRQQKRHRNRSNTNQHHRKQAWPTPTSMAIAPCSVCTGRILWLI